MDVVTGNVGVRSINALSKQPEECTFLRMLTQIYNDIMSLHKMTILYPIRALNRGLASVLLRVVSYGRRCGQKASVSYYLVSAVSGVYTTTPQIALTQ